MLKIIATLVIYAFSFIVSGAFPVTVTEQATVTEVEESFDRSGILIGGYGLNYTPAGGESIDTYVQYALDAGIDFLVTGNTSKAFLDACDDKGLGVILAGSSILPHVGKGVSDSAYNQWMALTYDSFYNYEVNGDKIYAHECIWGVDVCDEPETADFEKLSAMVAHFYATIPGKFAFVNLFPMYASGEQLGETVKGEFFRSLPLINSIDAFNPSIERYKNHIKSYAETMPTDYISMDVYPLYYNNKTDTYSTYTNWLRNLDVIAKQCNDSNRDFWVYIQSSGVKGEGEQTRYPDEADVRWQSYVSLSFGVDTIIHACYCQGWWDAEGHLINEATGERTEQYYSAQTVDNEIKSFSSVYGNYDNLGAFVKNIVKAAGTKTNYLYPVDDSYKPITVTEDPVLVGCFKAKEGNGKAYTFVNMWEPNEQKTATFTATFDGATKVTVYRNGVKTIVNGNSIEMTLAQEEGIYVTVE